VQVVCDDGRRPRIVRWEHQAATSAEDQEKALAALDRDMRQARCTTVLAETDYKLLLTEAPDVKPDELKSAIRWRIKELIDFHINDAVLDVFELPGEQAPGLTREMYVVAARAQHIQERADLLTGAGVNLDIIDIPELAQRNLAAQLSEDAHGLVMLSLQPERGLITITRQGMLYLSRNLNIGYEVLAQADDSERYFDQIVLEVQRSLDYFESHFRQAPIRHLALAPLPEGIPGLIDQLNSSLNINASAVDLSELLECEQEMPAAMQARCLTAVGAALRTEVKAL
jgi:MSHA biogenesis protein MshI